MQGEQFGWARRLGDWERSLAKSVLSRPIYRGGAMLREQAGGFLSHSDREGFFDPRHARDIA